MKNLLIISVILTGMIFFGCSKDNSLTNPGGQEAKTFKLISLPSSGGLGTEAQVSLNFDVDGQAGLYKTFDLQFPESESAVTGSYLFPQNVFTGQKNINVVFSNNFATADYSPSPFQFDAPIIANLTYSGIDLSSVTPEDIEFAYLPTDNTIESVVYDAVEVDKAAGTIKVINARIYHFSRYGFVEDPQP